MSKKRAFILLSVLSLFVVVIGGGTWYTWHLVNKLTESKEKIESAMAKQVEIVLKRSYICGTEDTEKLFLNIQSENEIKDKYFGWELVEQNQDRYIFRKSVADISPACKENGYFGITSDGHLTLYLGRPEEKNVIKSFFQIDTEKLKSSVPQEEVALLYEGIRVRDIAEFNSILSTYADFADTKQPLFPGN